MAEKKTTKNKKTNAKTDKATKVKLPKAVELAKQGTTKVSEAGKSNVGGFIDFVREQGVVGLAVGLAVGTAAGASVRQIVDQFISPIVGFIIGGIDLNALTWVVFQPNAEGRGGLEIGWGAILSSLITLIATAFVIYWIVHVAKLDRLDKKKS